MNYTKVSFLILIMITSIFVISPSAFGVNKLSRSSDGEVNIRVEIDDLIPNQPIGIHLILMDSTIGIELVDVNYNIIVTQNDKTVISEKNVYSPDGRGEYTTSEAVTSDSLDFTITILGFGPPNESDNWKGPKGGVVQMSLKPVLQEINDEDKEQQPSQIQKEVSIESTTSTAP